MKRILKLTAAIMAVLGILFGLAACSDGIGSKAPNKEIAIITQPENLINNEEYLRAISLSQSNHASFIATSAVPDSRNEPLSGITQVYNDAKGYASQDYVGALIFAGANRHSLAAAKAAKQRNPKLIIACTAPEEDIEQWSEVADLIIAVDTVRNTELMVENAHENGAQVFLFYSAAYQRNFMSVKEAQAAAKAKCEQLGMEYKQISSYDPAMPLGIKGAGSFIREDLARQMKNFKDKKLAAFAMEKSAEQGMITFCKENGIIFAGTGFPSLYEGFAPEFELDLGKNWDSKAKLKKQIKSALNENGENKGQFFTWDELTGSEMLDCAVEYCRARLCGETPDMEKTVKANFSKNIKISDKEYKNCCFIYAEEFCEL